MQFNVSISTFNFVPIHDVLEKQKVKSVTNCFPATWSENQVEIGPVSKSISIFVRDEDIY